MHIGFTSDAFIELMMLISDGRLMDSFVKPLHAICVKKHSHAVEWMIPIPCYHESICNQSPVLNAGKSSKAILTISLRYSKG